MRVLLAGATGTIGRATLSALLSAGHEVVCPMRDGADSPAAGATVMQCDVTDADSLRTALQGVRVDAVLSCLASRTGAPDDARRVDLAAQLNLLETGRACGADRFVLLSAICVQKPELAFQRAKLAFEGALQDSGLIWTIVRPTAFFKSLSGQFDRVRAGKPFLVFGDGRATACKPISDRDLARFLVDCLTHSDRQNRILPIGGPGPAMTPREQGAALFAALGRTPSYRQVPFGVMDAIVGVTSALGRLSPGLAAKSELARIGRYYARESMLVWDATHHRYDADATPETGSDRIEDHYRALARGETVVDLREHAVF